MDNIEDKIVALSEEIQNKEGKVGLEGLKENERQFYLIDNLLMELNNGGFHQYFTNSSGQNWKGAMSVLEKFSLKWLSKLVKKAKDIYDNDEDEDDKLDKLNDLDDVFYDKLDYDKIYEKMLSLFNESL